jgi:hypothetical protein
VSLQPAAVDLIAALSPVLDRWGRWYIFGAQAVIAHGVPRLSADVDVTLGIGESDTRRFVEDMQRSGFDPLVDDADFIRRTHVIPFVHRATAMPLDVVLASSGLEEEFLERATRMDLGGVVAPLIDAEDLVIAKVIAGRPKDIDDARGVWKVRGRSLDAYRIERILRMLEEALSQSDLLSSFEAIRRA